MGKPRMIILIRHAQSEGNKNRDIHQMIPDHRVKLTDEGKRQAVEAGHRLRKMLRPDDKIQFFTSPYRRTRETTEGILSSLTASDPETGPSNFPRNEIKVFEEPRLREQDFGNFQPCSTEMERMWQERADYGHFFYRIPNGESAADAYDRVSGFNESLWRNFSEADFPSVCVLVTHGLMTRVFLMKWYHWSVEYFEDLRNVNHCEFVIMRQNETSGKYALENELRTWSELKQRAAATALKDNASLSTPQSVASPSIPFRKWGGCQDGCNHHNADFPRRRKMTQTLQEISLPPAATPSADDEKDDGAVAPIAPHDISITIPNSTFDALPPGSSGRDSTATSEDTDSNAATDGTRSRLMLSPSTRSSLTLPLRPMSPYGHFGRDAGGSLSGAATPAEGLSDLDSEGTYFSAVKTGKDKDERPDMMSNPSGFAGTKNAADTHGRGTESQATIRSKRGLRKRPTEKDLEVWARESGMGTGARADPLGDEAADEEGGYMDEGGDVDDEGVELDEIERSEKSDRSLSGSVY